MKDTVADLYCLQYFKLNLQRFLRLILINAVRQSFKRSSYQIWSGKCFIYLIQKDQTSYWPLSKRWLVPMRLQSHNKFSRHSKLVSSQVIPHRVWQSPIRNINSLSIRADDFLDEYSSITRYNEYLHTVVMRSLSREY